MEKGLLAKTGKSLKEWVEIVRKKEFKKHGEIISYLKADHGFTHGYANFVSHKARESDAGSSDAESLINNQYQNKENLFPIYESLIEAVKTFGEDVQIAPKKANVSLRRKKQFALIQPTTKTRVDLGLKFKDKPLSDRLEGSGIFGAMCTHRVRLSSPDEINAELISWLKEAYENAG